MSGWNLWEKVLWALGKSKHNLCFKIIFFVLIVLFSPLLLVFVLLLPCILRWSVDRLPQPSGDHQVGTVECEWNLDVADVKNKVRLFYPAVAHESEQQGVSWLPYPHDLYASAYVSAGGLPTFVSRYFTSILCSIKMPIFENASLASTSVRFPVILFSHGLYGCSTTYSAVCSDLASHGFIVVAVEHKDGSAAFTHTSQDNHTMTYQPPPAEWVQFRHTQLAHRVDEFNGALRRLSELNYDPSSIFYDKIDLKLVAAVGHSFGGATAVSCARLVDPLSPVAESTPLLPFAIVGFDPWLEPVPLQSLQRVRSPVLFVNTKSLTYPKNTNPVNVIFNAIVSIPNMFGLFVEITETRHQDQSDLPALMYGMMRVLALSGKRNPKESLQISSDLCRVFLLKSMVENSHQQYEREGLWDAAMDKMIETGNASVDSLLVHAWVSKGGVHEDRLFQNTE